MPLPSNSHHPDYYIFRLGDPNLNLHSSLASWEGGQPKLYHNKLFNHHLFQACRPLVFPVFSWPCNLRFRDGIFQCFLGRFLVLTASPVVLPEKEHVLPSMESWLINKDPYIMVIRTHISCSYSSVYIVLSSIIIPIFNYKNVCVCVLSLHFQF